MNLKIGFAPRPPAEFVIVRIRQGSAGLLVNARGAWVYALFWTALGYTGSQNTDLSY